MGYSSDVREFTKACWPSADEGQTPPDNPVLMDQNAVNFIRAMVGDEMAELGAAKTVVEQADALVDAMYYICDAAAKHGMNLDPLFAIVHGANMQKVVDGAVTRREDGKILKPEGWVDPEPLLQAEVRSQCRHGSFGSV